jgi:hypothetical protein
MEPDDRQYVIGLKAVREDQSAAGEKGAIE